MTTRLGTKRCSYKSQKNIRTIGYTMVGIKSILDLTLTYKNEIKSRLVDYPVKNFFTNIDLSRSGTEVNLHI